jgi:hypothetical protein
VVLDFYDLDFYRKMGNTLLRGCALGSAIYCLGCRTGEGAFVVSGGRGFCQILSGRFEGLNYSEML